MSESPSPRPSPELLAALRRGKEELHAVHRALSLPEKVRMVIELQGIALPLIARRRPLKYYERQWPRDDEGNGGGRDG
jgi:hypothetical protein